VRKKQEEKKPVLRTPSLQRDAMQHAKMAAMEQKG
jgi:hypothetical protein